MATRQQVQQLLDAGLDYEAAGRRLGIPAGQAYMIATGTAADGGDTLPGQARQRGGVVTASQHLANPPAKNPTSSEEVRDWIAARVAADPQMRAAHQKAQQKNS